MCHENASSEVSERWERIPDPEYVVVVVATQCLDGDSSRLEEQGWKVVHRRVALYTPETEVGYGTTHSGYQNHHSRQCSTGNQQWCIQSERIYGLVLGSIHRQEKWRSNATVEIRAQMRVLTEQETVSNEPDPSFGQSTRES